ncbi:Hsp70 family protein [Amycolatopsis sp. lyj-109]|uniref:Hsp70 family protein n=1 Tax=Amycolatopsis sp. lyj-109 TaxID=2789287 RepID=UPI00397B4411
MSESRVRNEVTGDISGNTVQAGRIDTVIMRSPDAALAGFVPPPYRVPAREPFFDWLSGGAEKRVSRAVDRVAVLFPAEAPAPADWDRATRAYRRALRLALRAEPARAVEVFGAHDHRIPPERYPLSPADRPWLAALTWRADRHVLAVVFDVASRLDLPELQAVARDRMVKLLAELADADLAIRHLLRWRKRRVLTRDVVATVVTQHTARRPLERDTELWQRFFADLTEALRPDVLDVHCFLGHGADAVRLAKSDAEVRRALACCLRSPVAEDVGAGLELARLRQLTELTDALAERYGSLLTDAGRFAEALPVYQDIGRLDQVSRCHEELHRFFDALATCPADRPDRLAALADRSLPEVDDLVEQQDFAGAAGRLQDVLANLDRAGMPTAAVLERRQRAERLRADLLAATRLHFGALIRQTASDGGARQDAYRTWSRFEEAAGELALAAWRAEEGREFFRANQLFNRTGQFGEAARVLQGDDSPEALDARAASYEAGGDFAGAARLRQHIGQPDQAVALYLRAGDFAGAAHGLAGWLGAEAAEDPRLAECLRRTGEYDKLVQHCFTAIEARGERSQAVAVLRGLAEDGLVPPHLTADVARRLEELGAEDLRRFQERAQAWVTRARADVDRRYSEIWGFDLGTTTSAAAIYDRETRQPVFCPWKGHLQFASTLSLDRQGTELVGLTGEEILAPWLAGHIDAAKRRMGSSTRFKIRDRTYRPEEVAARMIRHARALVETFLAEQVRERVGELAAAELGHVRAEWLSWAERNHALRIDRPRVVVTVPAYFTNNQNSATRSACEIAEVELVRLVHEPTAACIAAAYERKLDEAVAVVDLGAGTLDLSLLEVGEGVYDVRDVGGDTRFGGKDFDTAITDALAARLEQRGIRIPASGSLRRRLEIAAESLKVALSAQDRASSTLLGFGSHGHVHLELTRTELAEVLAAQLATLRRVTAEFLESAPERPDLVVLVGRPMLSPLVRQTVEQVFAAKRVVVTDPRTAVAGGAALLGAMRSGALTKFVLLDITPLALGIQITDENERTVFSELVGRATTIPTRRSEIYTTHRDNQTEVRIQIFNGAVDRESKIGEFVLTGIRPAPKGQPQIEVTFDIDADCVLEVTARDLETKQANGIRVADTTLLSPGEVGDLTRRYEQQRRREQQRSELVELQTQLRELATAIAEDTTEGAWREFRQRQATHRPPATALTAETRQALVEMFNDDVQTELDLASTRTAAIAAVAEADACAARPAPADDDLEAAVAEAAHLLETTRARAGRLRELAAKIARWSAVLTRLALSEPDPLRRFRNHHATGSYREALDALDELPEPPDDPADVRRHEDCLAHIGDAQGYRTLRRRAGAKRPTGLPAGLVEISPAGTGFLIGERLVVANRPRPDGDAPILVTAGNVRSEVEHVHTAAQPGHDVVVLELTRPLGVPPLPLGRPELVRIGDQLWLPGPAEGGSRTLLTGVVNRFESTEQGHRLFRTSLALPGDCAGAPALDELGEVTGVAVPGDGGRILGLAALDALLRDAGVERNA